MLFHRFAPLSLFTILLLPYCSTLFSQELPRGADPFAQATNGEDPKVQSLKGSPHFVFEVSVLENAKETSYSLGKLQPRQQVLIEFQLKNETGLPLKFTKLSTSCGCIGGVPDQVVLNRNDTIPVRATFIAPALNEEVGKLITLTDEKNEFALRLVVSGTVHNAIDLDQTVFPVPNAGRETIETTVFFDGFRSDELRFRCNAAEVAGWRVIPEYESRGRLVVYLVMNPNTDVSSSCEFQAMSLTGAVVGTRQIEFRRNYHPAARPNKIYLSEEKEGLSGRVVVQMRGLTRPREVKQTTLFAYSRAEDKSELKIKLNAVMRAGSALLTLLELKVEPTDIDLISQQPSDSLFLSVATESESLEIPIVLLKQGIK